MKIGFLTACLPAMSLEGIVADARTQRFETFVVAAWPSEVDRLFTASHIDSASLDDSRADSVHETFVQAGLELSSLAYHDNLHPDPSGRDAVQRHVHARRAAAARLGVLTVGTFIGRDPSRSVTDHHMTEAERSSRRSCTCRRRRRQAHD